MMKLKGADILAALENGVSRVEDTAGRFPHVSGMTVKYDRKREQGKRVTQVMVGGSMLDPNKVYTLATNDYIANGGDGYAALKNGQQVIDASGATLMATMVMNYITKMGAVAPKLEGRITE
jgi:2',3'-cyclic-nucleotide 2'-phosphodiesterase (5'-nucleotidase family)